ncbi:hypothetical protein V7O62_02245 [Methanolobus sp. ZRKC2]|uniref:hypothetical protein n=1 Tax=Methanolobus sp. ZRKC2 TaxID=3125783 RepID=UPI0032548344
MQFETLISTYVTLLILGLIVYWYGLSFNNYLPYKVKKEEIYQYGCIFIIFFILIPLILSTISIIIFSQLINEKSNSSIVGGLILVFSIIYLCSSLRIFQRTNKLAEALKERPGLFTNKNIKECNEKKILILSYTIVITATFILYLLTLLNLENPVIEMLILSIMVLLILATLLTTSVVAALIGYTNSSYSDVKIRIKDCDEPLEGTILKHNDYLILLKGDKKIRLKEEHILSITEKE